VLSGGTREKRCPLRCLAGSLIFVSRRHLIPLLSGHALTLRQLARQLQLRPTEVEEDLRHLARSLVHGDWTLVVTPSVCRKCGFEFGPDKLHKPSKCPACHSTWLTEPQVGIVPKE